MTSLSIEEASRAANIPIHEIRSLLRSGLLFSLYGRISVVSLPMLKARVEARRQRARELAQQADAASREARP